MLLASDTSCTGALPPPYAVHASAHSSAYSPLFQRVMRSSSADRSDSFRFSFFFLPPRGCMRHTHLKNMKCKENARIAAVSPLAEVHFRIVVVNALVTALRHCCGSRFTVGICLRKIDRKS